MADPALTRIRAEPLNFPGVQLFYMLGEARGPVNTPWQRPVQGVGPGRADGAAASGE